MRKIVAGLFASLDGVVESPEMWSLPYSNAETGGAVMRLFEDADTALLGRHTYQLWSGFFPHASNEQVPTADWMNTSPKYVVSSTLGRVEEWQNSHLVTGEDVAGQIRALKERPGGNINVGGSLTLVKWLMGNGLLDELYLQINPLFVGSGRTLADGRQIPMTLASSRTFGNGVIEARYTL